MDSQGPPPQAQSAPDYLPQKPPRQATVSISIHSYDNNHVRSAGLGILLIACLKKCRWAPIEVQNGGHPRESRVAKPIPRSAAVIHGQPVERNGRTRRAASGVAHRGRSRLRSAVALATRSPSVGLPPLSRAAPTGSSPP